MGSSHTWRAGAAVAVLALATACTSLPATGDAIVVEESTADVEVAAAEVETTGREAAEAAGREAAEAAGREAAEAAEREAAEAAEASAREVTEREAAAAGWVVTSVVDGDTVDVRGPGGVEERVRVIGIDTPERGECGFGPASSALSRLVLDQPVDLVAGGRDDRDRYGRTLRYLDVEGVDAGLTLIESGLAVARYDSRDGYGRHEREDVYVAADAGVEHRCEATGPGGVWRNCTEAREAGAAPVLRGQQGYGRHLDRDDDGIGCE